MRAIRVQKAAGGFAVHWLLDDERTYCGRKPAELTVDGELELETLPALEACRNCERVVDGWTRPAREPGELRVVLPPAGGRLRTSGPLSHGSRPRSSRRLG